MTLDLARLHELHKLYQDSKTAPPDAMVPDDVLGHVRANDSTYHYCNFIGALHRAAPSLLAIAEAAEKWQAVHERPTSDKRGVSRALWDAVDAARKL